MLFSSFVNLKKDGTLMDLGTGNGILPILLSAKTEGSHFTGLEIQSRAADMARRSVEYNGLQDKISIVEGDIKGIKRLFPASSFDCVISNPPYMTDGHGLNNPAAPKAVARHEILCTLKDVVTAAAYLLKESGSFFLVHRPFRLPEIFGEMTNLRIEPKRLRFVYPNAGKEPVLILTEGRKGGKKGLKCAKPLIIYGADGEYTGEVKEIYGIKPPLSS